MRRARLITWECVLFIDFNKKPISEVLIFDQEIIRQPCSEFNYGTSYTAKEYVQPLVPRLTFRYRSFTFNP